MCVARPSRVAEKKVLLVVSSYLPNIGGLQRVTSRLAVELSRGPADDGGYALR